MGTAFPQFDNTYCLLLGGNKGGEPHMLEFEASGAQPALTATARHGIGRTAQLFENGEPLVNIHAAADGFWVIMPPAQPAQSAT